MKISAVLLLGFFAMFHFSLHAQVLKPGFDLQEYEKMLAISVKNFYPLETQNIVLPKEYQRVYRSESIGLDNVWELWDRTHGVSVISIRGTSADPKSFLANAYAAMVAAKGELTIGENRTFQYELSAHPNAAVHIGWLISTAFLAEEIVPQIQSRYAAGIKDFFITGHSQGGAITVLLTAHLANLQRRGELPADLRFKTYSSAAPKVGNVYFASDYNILTQDGWGYNVVNADDWVPQTFLTVQKTEDFPALNIFETVKESISHQSFFKRLLGNYLYNKVDRPSRNAQRAYEKYFGKMVAKDISKKLPGFVAPAYYPSGNYVQSGMLYVLKGDAAYHQQFPYDAAKLMQHHQPGAYYYLVKQKLGN